MSDDNYLKCSCKECGNHIAFPKQSAGTTIVCPHCGQWTELTVNSAKAPPPFPSATTTPSGGKGLLLAALLGCVVLGAGAGVFMFVRHRVKTTSQPLPPPAKVVIVPTNVPAPKPAPVAPKKPQKSLDDFKVSSVELEKAKVGSLVYAVGTVTNASEFQRFGVQIELDLFGKNGKKLGVAKDYKDVIEPNHQWQFHALIPDPRTASVKVSSIKED